MRGWKIVSQKRMIWYRDLLVLIPGLILTIVLKRATTRRETIQLLYQRIKDSMTTQEEMVRGLDAMAKAIIVVATALFVFFLVMQIAFLAKSFLLATLFIGLLILDLVVYFIAMYFAVMGLHIQKLQYPLFPTNAEKAIKVNLFTMPQVLRTAFGESASRTQIGRAEEMTADFFRQNHTAMANKALLIRIASYLLALQTIVTVITLAFEIPCLTR